MKTNNNKKILLHGASFKTGNMGVSALAESSIKCLMHTWPDCEISLLASGYAFSRESVRVAKKNITITNIPVRFSPNILKPGHYLVLHLLVSIITLFRLKAIKKFFVKRNKALQAIMAADLVADITGGDSFSDIYGMKRFARGFLIRRLCLKLGKPLVFLPQTYGPFYKSITKKMASWLLTRSTLIMSRDQDGVDYLRTVLDKNAFDNTVHLVPDVAFTLDPRKPAAIGIENLAKLKKGKDIIGLNISGLLYNGGYTRDNMFNLKTDYRETVKTIIEYFLQKKNVNLLLVPHVFPPKGLEVESDKLACQEVYQQYAAQYKDRIFIANGTYNHAEIKYIIGLTDFFMGARMHSCIGALSQSIPAIGMAYSKKFIGVFKTIGQQNNILDLRTLTSDDIINKLETFYKDKKKINKQLQKQIPETKEYIINTFGSINLNSQD